MAGNAGERNACTAVGVSYMYFLQSPPSSPPPFSPSPLPSLYFPPPLFPSSPPPSSLYLSIPSPFPSLISPSLPFFSLPLHLPPPFLPPLVQMLMSHFSWAQKAIQAAFIDDAQGLQATFRVIFQSKHPELYITSGDKKLDDKVHKFRYDCSVVGNIGYCNS